MKKCFAIALGVTFAFLATLIAPIINTDSSNVAYAARWRCSQCGRETGSKDPYSGNQHCPKGGNHTWYQK